MDYKKVLQNVFSPGAYFGRVRKMILALDRPVLISDPGAKPPPGKPPLRIGPVALNDLRLLGRLVWCIALRQPLALGLLPRCSSPARDAIRDRSSMSA